MPKGYVEYFLDIEQALSCAPQTPNALRQGRKYEGQWANGKQDHLKLRVFRVLRGSRAFGVFRVSRYFGFVFWLLGGAGQVVFRG